MSQQLPNPQPTEPQSRPTLAQQSPEASTCLGKLTKKVVNNIVEALEELLSGLERLLRAVMGKLGRTVFLTIQDTIALSLIIKIPGLIYNYILGKNFSSYNVCMLENISDPSWLACYVIVTFKNLFWIVIAGRFLGRFLINIKDYWKEFQDSFNS